MAYSPEGGALRLMGKKEKIAKVGRVKENQDWVMRAED